MSLELSHSSVPASIHQCVAVELEQLFKYYWQEKINFFCADVDECITGEGNCDSDEYCINSIGSYKCSSKCAFSVVSWHFSVFYNLRYVFLKFTFHTVLWNVSFDAVLLIFHNGMLVQYFQNPLWNKLDSTVVWFRFWSPCLVKAKIYL